MSLGKLTAIEEEEDYQDPDLVGEELRPHLGEQNLLLLLQESLCHESVFQLLAPVAIEVPLSHHYTVLTP